MSAAEARSRSNRKPGPGVDKLANAARLGALEKEIGVAVKRHRDPGSIGAQPITFGQDGKKEKNDKDERIVLKRGF